MEGREAPKVKLVAAILYKEEEPLADGLGMLEELFSPLDFRGTAHPFKHTDYYEQEMGAGLVRILVAFSRLAAPNVLVEAKRQCLQLEQVLASGGRRRVNVDVGYLDLFKLVLASFKGRGNKLYLDDGVWADMTMFYDKGEFRPLPWSFPDFAAGTYNQELKEIRGILKGQLSSR